MDGSATVLLVDDPSVVETTASRLEAEHDRFAVVTATDIEAALSVLDERAVDCVVSNYEIPDANGLEFLGGLELLRSVRDRDPDLPFILFTAIGNEDIAREAIADDVTDYILKWEKADSYTRLGRRIEAAVARRQAERQATEQARINEVVRNVNDALVRAGTREAIERGVCTQLTASPPYAAAMLVERTDDGYRTTAAAAGGDPVADLPRWTGGSETAVHRAVATGDLQVTPVSRDGPWADAHEAGYRSVAALQIVFEGARYGTLVVYGTDADAFDDVARTVLAELVESAAYAFDAVEARSALRRQNERLERFASIVSHDLRNPLNVARGYLDLVENDTARDAIGESLGRMADIIDDVLQLARQDHSPEMRPLSLEAVVRDAWEQVETGDAELVVEPLGTVEGNESQLGRAFENLFRNAVEHGGATSVRVGPVADASDDAFYVEDDGSGIAADEVDRVFEAGYTTAESGTGFGLVIVSDVAEVHGWDVRAETSEAGGARFVFA